MMRPYEAVIHSALLSILLAACDGGMPPPGPGTDQGAAITIREPLTAESEAPVELPRSKEADASVSETARPLIAPSDGGARHRYYWAESVSSRGRRSQPTAVIAIPLGPTSSSPSQPQITVEEQSVTIKWSPPADARGGVAPTPEGLLPSRPRV